MINLELRTDKSIVFKNLRESNIESNSVAIPLEKGTKKCNIDFTKEGNRIPLFEAPENYAVWPEGDLVFIDIDDREEAPDNLLKNTTETFAIDSPHGEHRWVLVESEIPNVKRDWGEIRTDNQYVVGPGSKLLDCDNGCCSKSNPGIYKPKNDFEIQKVGKSELAEWINGFERVMIEGYSEDIEIESLSEGPEGVNEAQDVLRELQREHPEFFKDLHDRLNGGRGNMGNSLSKEYSTKIDRSRLDFVTLEHLYGVFRHYGKSHADSKRLAGRLYEYYSRETPYTKDGQKRKWTIRGKPYKHDMLDNAINQFDESEFLNLLNQSDNSRYHFNDYSKITYRIASFVVDWLIKEWDIEEAEEMASHGYKLDLSREQLDAVIKHPMYQDTTPLSVGSVECEYPSPKAVRKICSEIDDRTEETYKSTIRRLRRKGEIRLACLGGNDYRVYHSHLSDPSEAQEIRYDGQVEKRG